MKNKIDVFLEHVTCLLSYLATNYLLCFTYNLDGVNYIKNKKNMKPTEFRFCQLSPSL